MTRELREIVAAVESLGSRAAVLATVVDVRGSSYRLPGAKMLVLESGETFGTVSGGCLEADVLERTGKVLRTGEAEVFTYDTTDDPNSVFSLNMGCSGVIRILLERITQGNTLIKAFREADERRQRQVVATLISATPTDHAQIGGRIFLDGEENIKLENLPSSLGNLYDLRDHCKRAFDSDGKFHLRSYQTEQETFEFSFDIVKPSVSLLIFGAGADAIPLAEFADKLGWTASVIDHRPAYLSEERFPRARNLVRNDPGQVSVPFAPDDRTAAVLMTHNYGRDREILSRMLASDAFYVGALGPKRRTERLLAELKERGEKFSERQLSRLYAPVGLDIGADTPETIAFAIAAEIQAVLMARDGGHLCDRQGPIYDRSK